MTKNDPSFESFQKKFKQDIFPPDWVNPKALEEYDLLILGGGPGGMTGSVVARSLNARVALVEKAHFGGECLSYGCIPSKAFLRSSRVAEQIRQASEYGLETPKGWKIDFAAVMRHVHDLQATISPHDSPENFKKLGVDIFLGSGSFISPNTLEVANQTIRFKKAIVSTGTEPVLLNIPGMEEKDYLTNQNIFHLSNLPKRLAVIGAGPISCELSQAFLRFGTQVFLITHGSQLLSREDKIASDRLKKVFEKEGMKIFTHSNALRVEKKGEEKLLYLDTQKEPLIVDEILLGIGRKPVVEGLGLKKAQVSFDAKTGIFTNEYLQTSNPNIYASGDVASPYKFTHISKELCTLAVRNALQGHSEKSSSLIIPWCTYTDPEIAHIGLNEEEAKKQGLALETIFVEMAAVDRAILDVEMTGFFKLIVKENRNQILGATLMAAHAGDLISEISVAMQSENGLTALAKAIHPFPTQAEVLRGAAQAIFKKRRELVVR